MESASAKPRKRFFVEMFTRDISAQDCILDLIDNSIDSYIRKTGIDLLADLLHSSTIPQDVAEITVEVSPDFVRVTDNCGGIDLEKAKSEVFNFGHSAAGFHELTERGLGAYGVGLKRALFKLGKCFRIESHTNSVGFQVEQDLETWLLKDDTLEDWTFPLEVIESNGSGTAGTVVEMRPINDDLRPLFANPDFIQLVRNEIDLPLIFGPGVMRVWVGERVIGFLLPLLVFACAAGAQA